MRCPRGKGPRTSSFPLRSSERPARSLPAGLWTVAANSGTTDTSRYQSAPFSRSHPKIPQPMVLEPPRPVGVDDQSMTSADGSITGTSLSLGTVRIESGKMSPTFTTAKMTPPATASQLHRWEGAEVIDPTLMSKKSRFITIPFQKNLPPQPTARYHPSSNPFPKPLIRK